MTGPLFVLLRVAGAGMLLLAILHWPIGRKLGWQEDCRNLTPVNRAIFHVHTLFIVLMLVMMGLPCLLQPSIFLTPGAAGAWMTWSFAGFWTVRLYCQWFVYGPELWRGKTPETAVHWCFTLLWTLLALLFAACGCVQAGWLS